ncbi:MAG: polysaccharide deacetylase family protein [Bacillota bacterium]|nr:polysaccharide deacetylase family protein [Bacillota bacterium]NLJ01971.1 polysaccharide deacetylase family protein [Bacillota bacterium]
MNQLEFILRVLALIGIVFLISSMYWRLGKRLFGLLRLRERKLPLALISGILGVATILVLFSVWVYHGFGYQPDIYRVGNRASNKVAITFDDGPSEEFTLAILDILKEYDVPATFFMVGKHVEKYPHVAQRVVEEGHAIGNHTQSHRNLPTLSTLELQREVMEATAVIAEVTGMYPKYVRPPRGMYDDRFRRLAGLLGQEIVLWSISTRDWRYGVTPAYIERLVESKVRGGDIILFHDSGALVRSEGGDRRATVLSLANVIEIIRAKGLEIVSLEELLHGAPPEEYPVVDRPE